MNTLEKLTQIYDDTILSLESSIRHIKISGAMTKDERLVLGKAAELVKDNVTKLYSLVNQLQQSFEEQVLNTSKALKLQEDKSFDMAKEVKKHVSAISKRDDQISELKSELKAMKARNDALQKIIDANQKTFLGSDE